MGGRVAMPFSNIFVPTFYALVPTGLARPGPPLRSSSSSSSSTEPYWNGSIPPPAHGYGTGGKCGSRDGIRDGETPRMGKRDAETTGMGKEWGFRDPKQGSRDGSRDRGTPRMGRWMG